VKIAVMYNVYQIFNIGHIAFRDFLAIKIQKNTKNALEQRRYLCAFLLLSRHTYRKSVYADSEWQYEDVPARTEAGHWEGRKYQHQKPHCKNVTY
jgi:hypothetical protein